MDQGSYGPAAEEAEWSPPPRTVAKVVVERLKGRSYKVHAHSQILRIRAEDLNLGEDVAHFMLFSRPILPASPLSGKTVHRINSERRVRSISKGSPRLCCFVDFGITVHPV